MIEKFKLTYATMFDPPEELHKNFELALHQLRHELGKEHGMLINGEERFTDEKFEDRSPINTEILLGIFQRGTQKEAEDALAAARRAFPHWSRLKWQDRVTLLRKSVDKIDERIYKISAATTLEVGKNRMEALGDVAESAELIRYVCNQMEMNDGYVIEMERDPLVGYIAQNTSKLRPYGVWLVISPFNFPAALTGGPMGAALVAGNTVVIKPATNTPWIARMLAECLQEAGIPEGVFNYVTGPGSSLGQALITCANVDGVTFTGSFDVGMQIFRDFSLCGYPRPIILEMGGKNPAIVTKNADLERATTGIVRSAFGLQGQKCSACSRVYIEETIYDQFEDQLVEKTRKLTIGDPAERNVYLGPVIDKKSYQDFQSYCRELSNAGRIITGGAVLEHAEYTSGYFCTPTLVTDLPLNHRLWKHEMFLPITILARVKNLDQALKHANDISYGLTAGIYGNEEDIKVFFDNIEVGVAYANRLQGATTGAWPGFQPFGGWKGSGSSGKNAGGYYYLPLYMHEQIQTIID